MPVAAIGAFIGSAIAEISAGAAGLAFAAGAGSAAAVAIDGAVYGTLMAGLEVGALLGISAISTLLQPVGHDGGTQVDFMANPQAGVPYLIGRTGTAGNIVMTDSAGTNSAYLSYATVFSLGPIAGYESFQANTIQVNFDADGGEGAGTQNALTSITEPLTAGSTVLPVGSTNGFSTGQTVSIDGHNYTLERVDQQPKELTISPGLQGATGIYDQVKGASATSPFKNRMWLKVQLGAPNSPLLTFTNGDSKDTPANHSGVPAVWTADCKLSGLAATLWTLEYDAQTYSGGTPRPMNVARGVFVYDPRLDSTYSGGSGSCRATDEATWVYSENPFLHGLTWCIGRTSNGVKTLGVKAPLNAIDIPAFVHGANVADSNGWTLGGVVYSTDSKWAVLKSMLQAGSGLPIKLGAKISCFVNAPLVSLDTLTGDDVVGKASIAATTPSRDRINAIWPRYREEQQGWQIVPTQAPIIVADYVTADRGQRTKEVEYTLCQSADQVATLARYDIENARELTPVTLPCKPRWMGYEPGDCITIDEPEYGLIDQPMLILSRQVDPASLVTTLTLRSETPGKHAFALGQTAFAPTTPSLQGFDASAFLPPGAGAWAATAGSLTGANGESVPVITVTGAVDNPFAASVIFDYSVADAEDWIPWAEVPANTTTVQITGLAPSTQYIVGVRYRSVKDVISSRTEITPELPGGAGGPVTTGPSISTGVAFLGAQTLAEFLDTIDEAQSDITTLQGDVDAAQADADAAAIAQIASTLGVQYERGGRISATHLPDGTPATTAILQTRQQVTDGQNATAALISLIGAENDDGSAFVFDGSTAQVSPGVSLSDKLTILGSDIDANSAAISTEETTRSDADSALSAELTSLTATVGSNTAAITSESITRANADSALSALITTLTSTVSGNTSAITSEAVTRAAADSTLASEITSLTSTVSGNTASISSEAATRASSVNTLSGEISTLTANYNGLSASVSQQALATASLGQVYGTWGLEVTAGNEITGVTFYSASGPVTTSLIRFNAATTEIDGDLIVDGSLTTGTAEDDAWTEVASFTRSSPTNGSGGNDLIFYEPMSVAAGATVTAIWQVQFNDGGGNAATYHSSASTLYVNGVGFSDNRANTPNAVAQMFTVVGTYTATSNETIGVSAYALTKPADNYSTCVLVILVNKK